MIGILSDSHDNLDAVRQAVRFFRDSECRLIIHAGDFVAPFTARVLEGAGCPVKAVFGNCDGEKAGLKNALEPFGTIQKAPLVFPYEGTNILVTHLNGLVESLAACREYGLIVFGHTHKAEIRTSGPTLIVNPGEAGGWVTGRSTVALFDPKTGVAEIHSL
jgi:putative phosphoesterase